jgi:hypothetical protein
MNLKCLVGMHAWSGCKCPKCGKTREGAHEWTLKHGYECAKCGKAKVPKTGDGVKLTYGLRVRFKIGDREFPACVLSTEVDNDGWVDIRVDGVGETKAAPWYLTSESTRRW